jgi:hypothetical protein
LFPLYSYMNRITVPGMLQPGISCLKLKLI